MANDGLRAVSGSFSGSFSIASLRSSSWPANDHTQNFFVVDRKWKFSPDQGQAKLASSGAHPSFLSINPFFGIGWAIWPTSAKGQTNEWNAENSTTPPSLKTHGDGPFVEAREAGEAERPIKLLVGQVSTGLCDIPMDSCLKRMWISNESNGLAILPVPLRITVPPHFYSSTI